MIRLSDWRDYMAAIALIGAVWTTCAPAARATPRINVVDAGRMERDPFNPQLMETVFPAIIRIDTDEPITVRVLSPFLVNGPDADPRGTRRQIVINHEGRRVRSNSSSSQLEISRGTTDLSISMQVERPNDFLPGRYLYQFDLLVDETQ